MSALTNIEGAVFAWVLQTTWRGVVLAALILLAQWLFRRRLSPAWRHGLWLLLIVRLAIPFSPQAAFSIFNLAKFETSTAPAEFFAPAAGTIPPADASEERTAPVLTFQPMEHEPPEPGRPELGRTSGRLGLPAVSTAPIRPALDWFRIVTLVWLAGAAWFTLRLAWLHWRFRSRIRLLREVSDRPARQLLRECASRLGVRRRVRLIETGEVETPALFGLGTKRLLLPEGILARVSSGDLRHIFLHELAHLKRRDLESNCLVELLRVIHWFNPVLWFAFARMRADREMAADAAALAAAGGGDNTAYGETILRILEGLRVRAGRPGAIGIAEERTRLAERMRAIAGHGQTTRRPWAAAGVALALAALGLTDRSAAPQNAALTSGPGPRPDSSTLPGGTGPVLAANAPPKSARTPAFLQALKTLRACKPPWDASSSPMLTKWHEAANRIETSINPSTTELIPDLIAVVIENPNAGVFVQEAMDRYAIWGIMNRRAYGMEYAREFEPYLRAPQLQARLVGAFGMAVMNRENAGALTLHTALEGLSSPDEEVRSWSGQILGRMFPGQFQLAKLEAVSTERDEVLARMFPREGQPGFATARSFSETEILEAERTLWADLARSCRDQLKRVGRDTRGYTWMVQEENWAATQGRLGRALVEQAILTRGSGAAALLAEAADSYRAALEDYTPERCGPVWGWYEDNLGLVLTLQAERTQGFESHRLLWQAVEAHRAALGGYPEPQYDNCRRRVAENLHQAEGLLKESEARLKASRSGSRAATATNTPPKSARTPELLQALKTLREFKSYRDMDSLMASQDARTVIQTNIQPSTTELIPDLIAVVKANPKAGRFVRDAMNQYAVWSALNRFQFGMEFSEEFEPYLRAETLQARLIGAAGMALMDRESAGPETLRTAFEGLSAPDEETRGWAEGVFSDMFAGQFRFEKVSLVSVQVTGILARLFPPEGRPALTAARPLAEADVQEAERALWAELADSSRESLKRTNRNSSSEAWILDDRSWAAAQGRLGRALVEQAKLADGPEAARFLTRAVEAYREAMKDYTRVRFAPEWAWCEDNLGLTLVLQAGQTSGTEAAGLLREAVQAHRAALEAYPAAGYSNRRARVTQNLHRAEALLQKLRG